MTEAYPLVWPAGWPRTTSPGASQFQVSMARARDRLLTEIHRLGGRYPVLSSNLRLRLDGLPLARQPEPADAGVAVYFERKGHQMVFACDRYWRVRENIRAIGLTIEAIRGIERWGASEMMERSLRAFEALPAPPDCWGTLGIGRTSDAREINDAFRQKAKTVHPDVGGAKGQLEALVEARDQALGVAAEIHRRATE